MTTLESLGVLPRKEAQFNKKGIYTGEDLVRYLPYKYLDLSQVTGIRPRTEISVITGTAVSVDYANNASRPFFVLKVNVDHGPELSIYWFGQEFKYGEIKKLVGKRIVASGKVDYLQQRGTYAMTNPTVCSEQIHDSLKIYPSYSKIRGMAQDYLEKKIAEALSVPECVSETIPQEFIGDMMSMPETLRTLHHPESMEDVAEAQNRIRFDELLYFALRLELASHNLPSTSKIGITDLQMTDKLGASLPFTLTESQRKAVKDMIRVIRSGKRLNALVEGDVGAGKTIVAFMMITSLASGGSQAALVAPTKQLAQQHYEDMVNQLTPLGLNVAFLGDSTTTKASVRKKILAGLEDGTIQVVVGTHALFSPKVKFQKLGLVIIDEEHKFGVAQRKALTDRVSEGVHCITMSATPIPRSLAYGLYGDSIQIYTLQKPSNRLPVRTIAIDPDTKTSLQEQIRERERLNDFMRFQKASGHQTYVVCPAIEKGDSESMEHVMTVERAQAWLDSLKPDGITYEVLTGKTKKSDAEGILERFRTNQTNVLLATSVVEVGINVPSATGILILSPDRFGLASLHQLRGRVGRGGDQAYCVMFGRGIADNDRIKAMCATNDGFKIAEEDLRIRGAGDFLGTQQSGDNKYVTLMLSDPEEFKEIKKLAKKSLDENIIYPLLERAVEDFRKEES